jgi:hypothetical protein
VGGVIEISSWMQIVCSRHVLRVLAESESVGMAELRASRVVSVRKVMNRTIIKINGSEVGRWVGR